MVALKAYAARKIINKVTHSIAWCNFLQIIFIGKLFVL